MVAAQSLVFNPLISKELRTRLRSRYSLAVVTLDMLVVGAVVIVFLLQHKGLDNGQSQLDGSQLFEALAIFQLCLILFVVPASMASTISGERQRQTWDLLWITHLTSFDIIWAKLLAGLAMNVILLFAALPLFGAVFLFGGVTPVDVVRTYVVLLATILLLSALSMLVSALSSRPIVCVIVSNVVSMVLGLGLSLIVVYVESGQQTTAFSDLSQFASFSQNSSPLPPVAEIDPLIALMSVLPSGHGGTVLGSLGTVQHAFGLPLRLPLWGAFGLCALAVSIALLGLSTVFVRRRAPWLAAES
jgi:ABC-type transport system involved in multi-copper enzyme maturation permease subunit